eukprot:289362-Pelagomonas_calceolata.AAC.1
MQACKLGPIESLVKNLKSARGLSSQHIYLVCCKCMPCMLWKLSGRRRGGGARGWALCDSVSSDV